MMRHGVVDTKGLLIKVKVTRLTSATAPPPTDRPPAPATSLVSRAAPSRWPAAIPGNEYCGRLDEVGDNR